MWRRVEWTIVPARPPDASEASQQSDGRSGLEHGSHVSPSVYLPQHRAANQGWAEVRKDREKCN